MKILVIRLGAVGDIIRTVPSVIYLKNHFENLQISWIAEDWASNLLLNHPDIDKLYTIPRKNYFKIFDILKDIRSQNFDYILDFHGILKSGLISAFSGVKKRVGYSRENCKEFNSFFNNIHVNSISEKVTRIEKNFHLISHFINDFKIPEKLESNFFIEPEKIKKVENFFSKIGNYKFFIGLNPCTSKFGSYKEWPINYYNKLIQMISQEFKDEKFGFIITWGPGEEERVKPLGEHNNSFLSPKTDMKELMVIISKLNLFITGDTGPMHLASTLNIPVLALFGPSDSEINKPWGRNNRVVKVDVGCNPCRKKKCEKLICQKELLPEIVFQNFKELWQKIRN